MSPTVIVGKILLSILVIVTLSLTLEGENSFMLKSLGFTIEFDCRMSFIAGVVVTFDFFNIWVPVIFFSFRDVTWVIGDAYSWKMFVKGVRTRGICYAGAAMIDVSTSPSLSSDAVLQLDSE